MLQIWISNVYALSQTSRTSSRSRKMPAYLGEFTQSHACPSGVPAQANQSNGNKGSIHSLLDHEDADDEDMNHGVGKADLNQSTTCPCDLGVEQGTADEDEDAGGDPFINSDDKLNDKKSKSKDEEEGNHTEHAPP